MFESLLAGSSRRRIMDVGQYMLSLAPVKASAKA